MLGGSIAGQNGDFAMVQIEQLSVERVDVQKLGIRGAAVVKSKRLQKKEGIIWSYCCCGVGRIVDLGTR